MAHVESTAISGAPRSNSNPKPFRQYHHALPMLVTCMPTDVYALRQVVSSFLFSVFLTDSNQLYTDEPPFGAQFRDVSRIIKGDRPPRPKFLGGELMDDTMWDIVQKCWAQEPADRFSSDELVDIVTEAASSVCV